MKTIAAHRINMVAMSVKKNLPRRVIDNEKVMNYVGIGWVDEGKATKEDYKQYPVVTRKKKMA